MANIQEDQSFVSRFNARRQPEYAAWLGNMSFNVGVHLFFNSDVTLSKARSTVKRCFRDVDRELVGTRFHKKPASLRTTGVFFFEHLDTNLHAHGLLRVREDRLAQFEELFPATGRGLWTECWESGSQTTEMLYDAAGFADYITKEQKASAAPETMLWLEEAFNTAG
jgi:hypothetical protein